MKSKVTSIRLPGLIYSKIVDISDTVLTTYIGMKLDHFQDIVSISKTCADYNIGPRVLNVGTLNKEQWIVHEKMYEVIEMTEFMNSGEPLSEDLKIKTQQLVQKLHDIGICHGDIICNIMQNINGQLVFIDFDTSFYIGKSNLARLTSYADAYSFNMDNDLEQEFIDGDVTSVDILCSD